MTRRRALAALESRYGRLGRRGLARLRRVLGRLGNPHDGLAAVHVAGTNGKGSVCAMVASVLREAGLKAGLYTSPHLRDVRERIVVDGRPIAWAALGRALGRVLAAEKGERLGFFELLTAAAFLHFRARGVDVAVLETGLGGRFDATNVVRKPLAAAVTSVDYDHTDLLGGSLASIAREKAGVFKRGVPALCGDVRPAARRALAAAARAAGALWMPDGRAPAWRTLEADWQRGRQSVAGPGGPGFGLGLLGQAQARNAALVVELAAVLRRRFDIPARAVRAGLARAEVPGRFEVARLGGRTLILDVAHNEAAVRNLRATLEASPWARAAKTFIIGTLKDKRHEAMLRVLEPHLRRAIAVRPRSPRALEPGELAAEIARAAPGCRTSVVPDPVEAFRAWLADGRGTRVAVAYGSFFVVGPIRASLSGRRGGRGRRCARGGRGPGGGGA